MSEPGTSLDAHHTIEMSHEERDAFLRESHTMSCATYNPDGTIHLVPMWYGFLEGAPAFETKAKSQKVRNLRRDSTLTCLIENVEPYDQRRGVELVGHAEIIEDRERLFEIGKSVLTRTMGISYTPDLKRMVETAIHKRVGVKINIETCVSWDHRKLGEVAGREGY